VNSPGRSCIANVILWSFHCSRSWMPSSANKLGDEDTGGWLRARRVRRGACGRGGGMLPPP
jgi:hypothetical protein